MEIHLKRVYDEPADDDGCRVLVDRLWPRGLSKDAARVDVWLKDIAPSSELRKWFHADRSRFEEFRQRYVAELRDNPAVDELRQRLRAGPVTLLYGAKDEQQNHAVVLKDFVRH